MSLLEKYLTGALALTAVYLVLANPRATNDVLGGLGTLNRNVFTTLQGR